MNANPVVSVCIPAYNDAAYLRAAVQSVLAQTFQNFEIVIVDDASSDGTMDAICDLDDPRIRRYTNEANMGGGGNWNRTVQLALGRYIKVLCSDDLLYPACLEKQARILDAECTDIGLVGCWRDIINGKGGRILARKPAALKGHVSGNVMLKRIARSGTNPIGEPAAVMFRKELFDKAGPFDGSNPFVLDIDMWCRMLQHADLYMIPQVLCAFRVAAGSWSVQLARRQSRSYRQWLSRIGREPAFGLSRTDIILGLNKARVLNFARMLFYRRHGLLGR